MSNLPETVELPGLVDLHVHLREPGDNKAETIESGTKAAMLGGYVLICDMPNNPGEPTWTEEAIKTKHKIARQSAWIPTAFYAGWQPGNETGIHELPKMATHAIGLKLYGAPTTGNDKDYEAQEFRAGVEAWHEAAPDKPIMFHAGTENLEDMIGYVAGDFGHHLHVCHVNSRDQVSLVIGAKADELPVTAGVTPHHLLKTSHDVRSEGWFARMQPPLAEQADAEYLMHKLDIGDIDVIETDHAPHSQDSKWDAEHENPFGVHDPEHKTCFGVPGIEFAAGLMLYQVKKGHLTLARLISAMSHKPAEIIGVKIGKNTKVTLDTIEYRIYEDQHDVISGSGWTPFLGKIGLGGVERLTISGETLVDHERTPGVDTRVISQRGTVI